MPQSHERAGSAMRGATRLAFSAVIGVTRTVEQMHSNIAAGSSPIGDGTNGRTEGISGFVYECIRLAHRGTGFGADQVMSLVDKMWIRQPTLPQPQWDSVLGVLNGIVGDQLASSENPLAIPMQLRRNGRRVDPGDRSLGQKPLILVHGLCMNDRRWSRDGHDHGRELERDLGYSPLYLFYNTGRHISQNGRELSALLEEFVLESSGSDQEITILAHSMGGLVVRSAHEAAAELGHTWPRGLRRIVFLGTPHHGAPLERIGHWIDRKVAGSPYMAPIANLALVRSAGIMDLREGALVDEDWEDTDSEDAVRRLPKSIALPKGVHCHAIAATLSEQDQNSNHDFLGDGLVPIKSALGQHSDPMRSLNFESTHQWTTTSTSHFELLSDREVYAAIRSWFDED